MGRRSEDVDAVVLQAQHLDALRRQRLHSLASHLVLLCRPVILHRRANLRGDRYNRCGDTTIIYRFSKWRRSAILDFQKFGIFTLSLVPKANLRHRAEFHRNRSNGFADIAISSIVVLIGSYDN